jgi:hypothetical protein
MSESSELFVRNTVSIFPELRQLFDEHMRDNFDQMLPHIFFGDVTRWFDARLVDDPNDPEAIRLSQYLESIYDVAPEDVQNVIYVSFVENLETNGPGAHVLGPQLRAAAEELGVLHSTDEPSGFA